jgi:hypothetical protein
MLRGWKFCHTQDITAQGMSEPTCCFKYLLTTTLSTVAEHRKQYIMQKTTVTQSIGGAAPIYTALLSLLTVAALLILPPHATNSHLRSEVGSHRTAGGAGHVYTSASTTLKTPKQCVPKHSVSTVKEQT